MAEDDRFKIILAEIQKKGVLAPADLAYLQSRVDRLESHGLSMDTHHDSHSTPLTHHNNHHTTSLLAISGILERVNVRDAE